MTKKDLEQIRGLFREEMDKSIQDNNKYLLSEVDKKIDKRIKDNNKVVFKHIDKKFEENKKYTDKKFEENKKYTDKKIQELIDVLMAGIDDLMLVIGNRPTRQEFTELKKQVLKQ